MFGARVHRYIFLFGMVSLAYGMMMGTVPTSVPQMILMGNWLLEGRFREKWRLLSGNAIFWILSAIFLSHALGLFWTEDLGAGWDDVRTKIPLMFLPMLLLSTPPLSRQEFHLVLGFFLIGSFTNTAWCLIYTHLLHHNEEVRNASRFMSHIRLGLFLNLAICVCVYLLLRLRSRWRVLLLLLLLYFVFCLYALGLASGMINLLILSGALCLYLIFRQEWKVKLMVIFSMLGVATALTMYVLSIYREQVVPKASSTNVPQQRTPWGSSYIHFELNGQKENGYYTLINIQMDEIQRAWKREFPADSFNYALQYNMERYDVLVRYLSSKGLNKDSLSMTLLTDQDKINISKGIINHQYPEWSFFHRRIYEFVNEFDDFRNNRHVSGRSATMRYYFWKAAVHLIGQQPFYGVGTGDVQASMNNAYKVTDSPLSVEWYKRPHNQFLTVTVAIGFGGLVILLLALFYPPFVLRHFLSILYWPFMIIAILSFMVEDTVETQAGCTFFAFFNSLFISGAYWNSVAAEENFGSGPATE